MDADLFLCSHADDARKALEHGMAAAHMLPGATKPDLTDHTLRIAFDGDAVLFSGEADALYREHGLARFRSDELRDAKVPLGAGPFKRFFAKLCQLQAELGLDSEQLRTCLLTARGGSNHGRPMNTLRHWGLTVNVAIFADGRPKGPFLRAFGADMFFDDSSANVESAAAHDIPAGRVLGGEGGIQPIAHAVAGAAAPLAA
jgi:5'-nucleotidase